MSSLKNEKDNAVEEVKFLLNCIQGLKRHFLKSKYKGSEEVRESSLSYKDTLVEKVKNLVVIHGIILKNDELRILQP